VSAKEEITRPLKINDFMPEELSIKSTAGGTEK
jgi:hypothetical protein